jgi:hypothetical protein
MPNEGWKGVFHVNGNGGYAGVLAYNYGAMEAAIRRRRPPLDGAALVRHPDKWKDWGMLGTHEAAVAGKEIAKAFYGADAKRSYYTTRRVDGDASKGIEMQRPLCPYPQRAWYKGGGDANSAANFACAFDKK